MNVRLPQNPGLGGIDELTSSEEALVQSLNALGTPSADRILFYDFSASAYAFLTAGSGLTITGTTIAATASLTGTINEIAYFDSATTITSLAVATYPSLTELSYGKGVTSAIQTQINTKGIGDMVLASVQTVSGAKTFNDTKFLLRNVANTFNGSFVNNNLADRIYTLPDKAMTIAGTNDKLSAFAATTSLELLGVISDETGTGALVFANTPTLVTPVLGVASATSINGNTFTTGTYTLTGTAGKTLTFNNSLTLAGTDTTTMTFPTTSATIARTDAANTFTGIQTFNTAIAVGSGGTGATTLAGASIATYAGTETLTNKRIDPRVQSVADAATVTPAGDTNDAVDITALAQAVTIAAPTGTPVNFQKLIIRFKDNATARAITWNAIFVAGGVALPTTTILSKILTLGFIYNTANTLNKWQLVASAQEA